VREVDTPSANVGHVTPHPVPPPLPVLVDVLAPPPPAPDPVTDAGDPPPSAAPPPPAGEAVEELARTEPDDTAVEPAAPPPVLPLEASSPQAARAIAMIAAQPRNGVRGLESGEKLRMGAILASLSWVCST